MEENKILAEDNGMLQMCIEMWKDYHDGKTDYETMSIEKYSRQFSVSKFPKNLIAPILLKRAEPTLEDANNLRVEINRYRNNLRHPSKEDAKAAIMEEQTAITVLKRKGYRVMKKTVAYIDL